MITSRPFLLVMRNISDAHCRENQSTHFVFSKVFFFFRKSCRACENEPEEKRPLGRPKRRWEHNIKTDLQEEGGDCGGLDGVGSR